MNRINVGVVNGTLPKFAEIANVIGPFGEDLAWEISDVDGTIKEQSSLTLDAAIELAETSTRRPLSWDQFRSLMDEFFQITDCECVGRRVNRGPDPMQVAEVRLECYDSTLWGMETTDEGVLTRARRRFPATVSVHRY